MTNILLACAAGLTLAWLVAAQRRLVAYAARRFLRLPRLQQVALVLAVGVMTVCAQKQVTGNKEQGTNAVAEAFGSDASRRAAESAEGEANVVSAENGDLRTETRSSSQISVTSQISKLRAKTTLTSSSTNPGESVKSVDKNLPRVTMNDVACGFALVEVRTNETVSYEMPTNGVEVGTWGKTGAYQDIVKVEMWKGGKVEKCGEEFSFVWGEQVVTSLWAHTWGKVRPRIRDRAHEIVAIGTPMSCVPGEGRLWAAAATNGTFILTWEKFREGREKREIIATDYTNYHGLEEEVKSVDGSQSVQSVKSVAQTNATLSAQIEFFPNGDFITRSNNVERVYRRVDPDDWDDDGIENEEDDEPMVAADETQFGPNQTLPDGANSNAYCWVDLVVPRANAKVTFTGDGASNLAEPSFIAKAGETNRVMLLIGKTYRVTCARPFKIGSKSSEEIEESWNGENEVALCWPVAISVATDGDAASDAQAAAVRQMQIVDSNNGTLLATPLLASMSTMASATSDSFSMIVIPSGLGGAFVWTNYCCSITGSDYAFELACEGNCGCGGCTADGRFVYEGYSIESPWGPLCRCSNHDEDDDSPSRGVSAYFTKNVIIFEDEYDNSPTEHVGWRSTETVLKCSANGGANGGLVRIEVEGADSLVQYNGKPLPYLKFLEPNETISFKNRYRAVKASNVANDIKVTATFVENETRWTQEKADEATAVKVVIRPRVFAPENECAFRHRFGIGETFDCLCTPALSTVSWRSNGGGTLRRSGSDCTYRCPLSAEQNKIVLRGAGVDYIPRTNILEPQAVLSRDVGYRVQNVASGQAGGILLTMTLHVLPLDVSFSCIRVEEVPDAGGSHSGYFADTYFMSEWYHGVAQGAGVWKSVFGANEFMSDEAGFARSLPQIDERGEVSSGGTCGWTNGTLTWNVPCGWADSDVTPEDDPVGVFSLSSQQIMKIDVDGGCEVQKHGNTVRRELDGTVYLNGRLMP